MTCFSTYDAWKLATPPEYDWPDAPDTCACGMGYYDECCCELSEPHPDELADLIDEAQTARTEVPR